MTLPKWATTVTPFSKTLALIIFITFPIVGFVLGTQYQGVIDKSNSRYLQVNQPKRTMIKPSVPIPSKQPNTLTPTIVPSSTSSASVTTPSDWKTYNNIKYNYQLRYPNTWLVQSLTAGDLSQTSAANFRRTNDETPSESGFLFSIVSNSNNYSLTDWIKQNPNNGILLPPGDKNISTIVGSIISINGLSWEKINDNSIGYIPTGYVKYGLAHNGNLYYIVVYSVDTKNIEQLLTTFKFSN